jgi:hypothetical protein
MHYTKNKKGSALAVTLILTAGIALILGSLLSLSLTTLNTSARSFHLNSAVNLAEGGLEEAMYALNHDDWTGWTGSGNKTLVIDSIPLNQGAVGSEMVLIDFSTGIATPTITSQGTVTLRTGNPISKQIRVKTQGRSMFSTGLVARDSIIFNGNNVSVDSWNSHPDDPNVYVPYSTSNRKDNGSVASLTTKVTVGNADIWGFVAIGEDGNPDVGSNGTIAEFGKSLGTVDTSRITRDFTFNLPVPTLPSYSIVNMSLTKIIESTSLPDTSLGDEYEMVNGKRVFYYKTSYLDLKSSDILTIPDNSHVVLILSAENAVSLSGNSSIRIGNGSSLTIYTAGDISISGNGVANVSSDPTSFQIYGTNSVIGEQDISVAGNGVLSGVINAPNADVDIKGGGNIGNVMGSFVGNTVTVVGDNEFHYDESLVTFTKPGSFTVRKWVELTRQDFTIFE